MHVLMVTINYPPDFGGAALQAIRLSESMRTMGVTIEFISDNGSNRSKAEFYRGFKVTRLRTFSSHYHNKIRELIYISRLFGFILTHPEFKIIHFHSMRGLEALIFPLVRMLGRKVILKLTLIDNDDPMTFKRRKKIAFIYMWGLRFISQFVAISQRLAQSAYEADFAKHKVSLIANGVDVEKFRKANPSEFTIIKKSLGLERFDKIFLSVGSIEYRKGYDLMIRSWAVIREHFPSAVLVIIGPIKHEDRYYSELLKYIKENNLDNIIFTGPKDNVQQYLSITDCFLFCSRAEGFGTVLIEAMASGVPVVAMNILGVTEDIVKDARLGGICYSGDPQDFARMAVELLNRSHSAGLSEAADEIRSEFDINIIAQKYVTLYGNLLKNGASGVV